MRKCIRSQNSHIRFAESIFEALLLDIAAGRPSDVRLSLLRDLKTVFERLRSEGIEFCTITLPTLAKAMLESFQTGTLTVSPSFKRQSGTTLPRFLYGLLKAVYTNDGSLRPDACIASITEALQILGLGYKLDVPYKEHLDKEALRNFIGIEREFDTFVFPEPHDPVVSLCRSLLADIFEGFIAQEGVPKHGPGTVATGEKGLKKWEFRRKYVSIHQRFPYYDYFVSGRNHLKDRILWYKSLHKRSNGISEILLVPKDSRGPRIISREPLEYQYIQQAVGRHMMSHLERCVLTRGQIHFFNQRVNQALAIIGSINGSYATLDMKDASDRISCSLVDLLVGDPLKKDLYACRTAYTKLPDYTIVKTHKFAPMGSALCFPLESVIHFALAVACICHVHKVTRSEAVRSIYVFGDDLIVRAEYLESVVQHFPRFGLMFNPRKCCTHGPFRESCGVNAFKGHDVTPIRWRKPWTERLDDTTVQAYADLAARFYSRCYYRVAELLWKTLECQVGNLPTSPLTNHVPYLSRKTRFDMWHTPHKHRFCLKLQSRHHYAHVLKLKSREREVDGYHILLQYGVTGSASSREISAFSHFKRQWTSIVSQGIEYSDFSRSSGKPDEPRDVSLQPVP